MGVDRIDYWSINWRGAREDGGRQYRISHLGKK